MTTMISHHKKRDNGNGPDRMSEFSLMHKLHKNRKLNLCLIQNLMMYQMGILQL